MKKTVALVALVALSGCLGWAADEARAAAGYDKGFFLASDDGASKLKLQGRVQVRVDAEVPDGGDATAAFSVPRARLTLSGTVLSKDLGYKLQVDFGKGQASLKDFYVDYRFAGKAKVRAGQFKRPFSRQQITSSSKLAFADRTLTDKAFGAGRDIGVALHNGFDKSAPVEWAVAVMNGTGDKGALSGSVMVDPATGEGSITGGGTSNVPDTFKPQVVARVGYNHGGINAYSEGDLEGGGLRFAVAGGVKVDFDADGGDDGSIAADVDFVLKASGFALDGAFYVMTAQDGGGFGDQGLAATGVHAQASYLVAQRWLPMVRFARVMPDGSDNDDSELSGGLTVFLHGHSIKLSAEASLLMSQAAGGDTTDWRTRGQLQVTF